nr:hypothetical protein [Bacillus altitudinis]
MDMVIWIGGRRRKWMNEASLKKGDVNRDGGEKKRWIVIDEIERLMNCLGQFLECLNMMMDNVDIE